MAIVGASGSGKSLLANAILGLLPENSKVEGSMRFMGVELTDGNLDQLRGKHIALIPQSINALDPLMKTGKQIYRGKCINHERRNIYDKLHLAREVSEYYPFELSGGMARRVLAATAMIGTAELIIADEPTPGLDPDSLNEMIKSIQELSSGGKGIIFITHDIETAIKIANKVAVLYGGRIVEITNSINFEGNGERLLHPYTKALWHALPQNGFVPLQGHQPYADEITSGCIFHPRCPISTEQCKEKQPKERIIYETMVRCNYA